MTYRRKLSICILFAIISAVVSGTAVQAVELAYPTKNVLIVFDNQYIFGYKTDYVNAFGLLLKHFNTDVAYVQIKDYKAGEIKDHDIIFYIGLEKQSSLNSDFLMDVVATDKRVVWIGADVERFIECKNDIGITYDGMSGDYTYTEYKGKTYLEKRKQKDVLLKPSEAGYKIWAHITNGSDRYPYIISKGNAWLFSRLDMGEDAGNYIMADVLHEVLGEAHLEKRMAFIRIEDIHPFREVEETRKTLEIVTKNKIPFMMAVIPAYYNGSNNSLTYLSDKPKLLEVLKHGTQNGGSVILHGFTHQENSEATGEGFEFWDARLDKPLVLDEKQYIEDRLNRGVLKLIKNDIFPLAFEPPHYAMSQKGYGITSVLFSTLVGQIQTSDDGFSTISYPYMLYNTYCGEYVVPENLSYVDPQKINPMNEIRDKAEKLQIVRDSVAGVFFHPYIDTVYLEEIVKVLRKEGYEFFDLKSIPNSVKTKNVQISNEGASETLKLEGVTIEALKTDKETLVEKSIRLYSWGVFIIVAFFCLLFLLIYLVMRKRETKNLFERKGE